MSDQYHIYLGVPGTKFCWGTTTGVVNCSKNHIVHPFNMGLGFSGVVDFNYLWADAQNLYEAGTITHFAMLHGDITPDPTQRWLDLLMDTMERRAAALVSAVSPIKDNRGITSSGICDPSNPWGAYKRFTTREILNELPPEFDNAIAGYPDKPLLHNTGMWVCDLRDPVFRQLNDDGTLRFLFRFPEKIARGPDGRWSHEQESEDWLFSRELWESGCKNTWITSTPKLTHHGRMDFGNGIGFGKYEHGDEDTAARWREDLLQKPLSVTQMIEFELGSGCNLGPCHKSCPNTHPERYGTLDVSRELDDDTIVSTAVRAYRDLGFTGLIGWIYYNEPLLQMDRMFSLMDRISAHTRARYILWTNGTLIPEDCERFKAFSQIVVSGYNQQSKRGADRLVAAKLPGDVKYIEDAQFDGRMDHLEPSDRSAPCLRPFTEFIIDNHGNVHLCCYDWQGKASPGNIFAEDFAEIAARWRESLNHLCGDKMTAAAPRFCQDCGHRWSDKHQMHDMSVIDRANRFRKSLVAKQEVQT